MHLLFVFRRLRQVAIASMALLAGVRTTAAEFAIYRSTDGGYSWSKAGQGVPAGLRTDAFGESGPMRLAGTERGIFLSDDDGNSWVRPDGGVPEAIKVFDFAVAGGRTYAATTQGVWSSSDHGRTWVLADAGLAEVRVLSLAVVGQTIVAGTDRQGARIGAGPGQRWENVSDGLPASAQLFQLAVSGDTVFAALYAKGVYRLDRSNRKWVPTAEERPLRLVSAQGILFAGRNPGGVSVSKDGGGTWQNASLGLLDQAPTWCLASRGDTVLIGTRGDSRLLRYEHALQLWKPSDEGLPAGTSPIALGMGDKSALVSVIADDTPPSGGRATGHNSF